jgi:hypothetical protein
MKTRLFTLSMLLFAIVANAQSDKAIFLHHSTGGAVFSEGGVEQWITDYNTQNATNYSITEFAYPNNPWGWENYAYDYWKLWVDGSCDNSQANIQCLDQLCQNYELIIFKHCFPGAGINEDSGEGDVTSAEKTLNNYKLQYRVLLNKLDQYPNNKFMVWTLAPLHRNATDATQAQRAGQFVNWVKNTWLTEDGKSHPNVTVFDFFGLVAEQSASPANGFQYCLKYDYEGDHDGNDSHPNTLANQTVGPLFARAVVNTLATVTSVLSKTTLSSALELYYDSSLKTIIYKIKNDKAKTPYVVEVYSVLGQKIKAFETTENAGSIAINEQSRVYIVRIKIDDVYVSRKVVL